LALGLGADGKRLGRNAPHLYNLAWSPTLFWDGRAASLEEQALGPIQAAGEMNMDLPALQKRLEAVPANHQQFATAYGSPGITSDRIGRAIANYQRTIVVRNTAFDRFMRGDDQALGPEAQRGMVLFVGKANCIACHSGPNFTDGSYHNLGTRDADRGRAAIEAGVLAERAFKTPGLRNIALSAPYLHDGSLGSLEAVVQFYNRGGDVPTPDALVKPLGLTDVEVAALVSFLGALTEPVALERPLVP
jgi:cytochrome c peroxidase